MKRNLVLWLEPGEMNHRIVIRGYGAVSFVLTSFIFSPALVMELGPYKDWGNSFLGGIWTHDLLHRSLSDKARGEQTKHTIGIEHLMRLQWVMKQGKGAVTYLSTVFKNKFQTFSVFQCGNLYTDTTAEVHEILLRCVPR